MNSYVNVTPEYCKEHYAINIEDFNPITINMNDRFYLIIFTKQKVDKSKYPNIEEEFFDGVNDGYHYYIRKISLNT